MHDEPFWTRLEYGASGWLASAADRHLRRFWIDAFIPETFANTRRGLDVEGTTWVGAGPRMQYRYRFVASIPQELLNRRNDDFEIESLSLNPDEQLLAIVISGGSLSAKRETAPKPLA